jgi:hypothetical protein
MLARLSIPHLALTTTVIKHIFHLMATLSHSVPVPILSEVIVCGGHGSSGTCLAMISLSTGAMPPIGSWMRNALVYPWEQCHGLAQ